MGRLVNTIPPAFNDGGRASPPPLAGFPPKYTPAHYEEVEIPPIYLNRKSEETGIDV